MYLAHYGLLSNLYMFASCMGGKWDKYATKLFTVYVGPNMKHFIVLLMGNFS